MMKIGLPVLSLLLVAVAPNGAQACGFMGQGGVCEATAKAEAVFVGVVQKVEPPTSKKGLPQIEQGAGRIARIRVEKVFKGKIGSEISIRSGLASCDPVYQVGEQRLFYASYDEETGIWSTGGVCRRSKPTRYAANDLLYLRGLPASAQQTRISGVVEYLKSDPEHGATVTAISGIKLKIIGKERTAEVDTDRNGIYEIYGLPPGEYLIKPAVPKRTEIFPIRAGSTDGSEDEGAKVELGEKSCAELNFSFQLDAETSIAGTVRGADGRPLPSVLLSLQPPGKRALQSWQFVYTNQQGGYRLENVPPGEYLIVVKGNGDISSYAPFSRVYYPGVLKEENAAVVQMTRGEKLENYDINLPPQAATYSVQGRLLYADWRPVEKGSVQFRADRVEEGVTGEVRTQTDAQGRFTLNILQGLEGRLSGFIYPDRDAEANCPAFQRSGTGAASILETEPLQLKITADLQDLKLLFSIVPCEKPKPK
ncbi:MAG TPA: carboxypeptidase-like regulatory domain-containing protein [Blastocatellia bacterium]|nr:carboxypeptidase-like regulatory domain-containing protein [Blastocatellia bacterium]